MLYINIDRNTKEPLTRQIYHFIKDAILQGTLQPDEKLPATRELAKYLNVARNVIIESYDQLIAEGYAYSRNGSGTYICEGVQLMRNRKADTCQVEKLPGKRLQYQFSFRTGIPDLKSIPVKKWANIYKNIALDIDTTDMDYQDPFGDYVLRTQLSLYLNRARGACTLPEHIMITNGAAQSFNLLCQLVPSASYALVENPLSYGILHTLESNHVKMKAVELDEWGLITDELPDGPPTLIFTTPSHQFPTGVVLPAKRRIELIKYAEKQNAYIVEDDYDSEFRFDGSPIQAMQYLEPERVIYVGTFSKTLMPALRIGYMVLPASLCRQMREIKYVADLHSPVLEQRALAKFIETGAFDQHIRKMRKLYLKKRNYLISCLRRTFGGRVEISGAEAGLHFAAAFKKVIFDQSLLQEIEDSGIEITAMNKHYLSQGDATPYDHMLVMGYGNIKIPDMDQAVFVLASIINRD